MLFRAIDNHQVDLPRVRHWAGVLTVTLAGVVIALLVHVVARLA